MKLPLKKLTENDVTDKQLYLNRRQFIKTLTAAGLIGTPFFSYAADSKFSFKKNPSYQPDLKLTDPEHALTYNNFGSSGISVGKKLEF